MPRQISFAPAAALRQEAVAPAGRCRVRACRVRACRVRACLSQHLPCPRLRCPAPAVARPCAPPAARAPPASPPAAPGRPAFPGKRQRCSIEAAGRAVAESRRPGGCMTAAAGPHGVSAVCGRRPGFSWCRAGSPAGEPARAASGGVAGLDGFAVPGVEGVLGEVAAADGHAEVADGAGEFPFRGCLRLPRRDS